MREKAPSSPLPKIAGSSSAQAPSSRTLPSLHKTESRQAAIEQRADDALLPGEHRRRPAARRAVR